MLIGLKRPKQWYYDINLREVKDWTKTTVCHSDRISPGSDLMNIKTLKVNQETSKDPYVQYSGCLILMKSKEGLLNKQNTE